MLDNSPSEAAKSFSINNRVQKFWLIEKHTEFARLDGVDNHLRMRGDNELRVLLGGDGA